MLAALFAALFSGCKKKPGDNNSQGYSYVNMRMTDDPANYQQVNIDIVNVEVNSDASGWLQVSFTPGIYNLLNLCNGVDTLIARGLIPYGHISQIRLAVGANNTVMVGNTVYNLTIPSGTESGIKLNVDATVVKGSDYDFLIDFDAASSIHETGSGKYMLTPVIRVVSVLADGGIKGIIDPLASMSEVYAISGNDSFGTFMTYSTGSFQINGLEPGSYNVVIVPLAPYLPLTITGVQVIAGVTTNVGDIVIH